MTPQTPKTTRELQEPTPQTFYEDRITSSLFYFLGKDSTNSLANYVFQTGHKNAIRIMTLDLFNSRMVQVDPSSPDYSFHSIADSLFFEEYKRMPPILRVEIKGRLDSRALIEQDLPALHRLRETRQQA
ncbi:MAG: hypothetical protein AABX17_00875 [Nanoarchaeota archaeon]|mgnify:CR=1 FL=1